MNGRAPLNRLPLGLLSLFDIKSGGRYPQHLGEVINPTMEMMTFIAASGCNEMFRTGVTNVVSVGIINMGVTVPADELWLVEYFTIESDANLDADQVVSGMACVCAVSVGGSSTVAFPVGPVVRLSGADATLTRFRCGNDRTLIVSPGGSLRIHLNELSVGAAASINLRMSVKILRLRA